MGTPPGWPAMRSSRPRSRICEMGQWKGSSRSDASKTQLGMMVTASERSHKHGSRGTTRVRPRTEASARASRSASKCRRTNSRCARSRGDRRSAVGTSQPVRYLSSKSLLADGSLSGGRGPARGCGGVKVRKPPTRADAAIAAQPTLPPAARRPSPLTRRRIVLWRVEQPEPRLQIATDASRTRLGWAGELEGAHASRSRHTLPVSPPSVNVVWTATQSRRSPPCCTQYTWPTVAKANSLPPGWAATAQHGAT